MGKGKRGQTGKEENGETVGIGKRGGEVAKISHQALKSVNFRGYIKCHLIF